MSQQGAIVQTTNTGAEMTPVLGTLQSVGPNNQASSILPNIQSNVGGTTTTTISQTQSQTQYISQSPKQVLQQSSTPSSFSDFPQVCNLCKAKKHLSCFNCYDLNISYFFDITFINRYYYTAI